jgi:hypothetical protein
VKRATSAGRLVAVGFLLLCLLLIGPAVCDLLDRANQVGGAL